GAGVEPACGCPRGILSPLRLPFRHPGRGRDFAFTTLIGVSSMFHGCWPMHVALGYGGGAVYARVMAANTPASSRVTMTQLVMPAHTNGSGTVLFGGVVMQWIDVCAGVAAMRHSRGRVVTASVERLDFLSPIRLGDV